MNVILVDDEPLALDYLEHQLRKVCEIDSIRKFTDPLSSLDAILYEDVDVVFLDIQLPEIDGIEFAEQLLERRPGIPIVFVTAYQEYAVEAFEINAMDYVMKPVKAERLRNTLNRLQPQSRSAAIAPSQADRAIRMQLFREVLIESADNQFIPIRWRTAKAQELFLYLLQHRDKQIRKDTLIEILWPEYEASKAYSLLYTTIYHIRKTLETYGNRFALSSISEGYMLRLEDVKLDVEEWENGLRTEPELPPEELASFEQWLKLYKGDYLQNFDYWWAVSERERLRLLWTRSAVRLAEAYRGAGQPESAIAIYTDLCQRIPTMEEAHYALMTLYAERNQHLAVARQYQLLSAVIKDEFGDQPSSYIREWYEEWSREQKE